MPHTSLLILFTFCLPLIGTLLSFTYRHHQTLATRLSCIFVTFGLLATILAACFTPWGEVTSVYYAWISASPLTIGIHLLYDPLSCVMTLLILTVSVIVHHYAKNYLDSDSTQGRFMAQLSFVTASVLLLVLSGNLLLTFVAWNLTGIGLYLLLNHYHYNPNANRSAMKKFLINRLGDLCFLTAVILAYQQWGSLDYSVILNSEQSAQPIILLLIFVAIMTKSAQFPFHVWLAQTMETPTPVSTLMHAGIINAGGFLLARLSPLYLQSPQVLNIIFSIGLITALLGSLFMLTQQDIKRHLAYSTISQMGFMVMQCGLACFSAAVFHLMAHGFYKGSLFLNAGSSLKAVSLRKKTSIGIMTKMSITAFSALLCTSIYLGLTHYLKQSPMNVALMIFVFVTVTQGLITLYANKTNTIQLVCGLCSISLVMTLYLLGVHFFDCLLAPSIGKTGPIEDSNHWKLLIIISIATVYLLLLIFIHNKKLLACLNSTLYFLSYNKAKCNHCYLWIESSYNKTTKNLVKIIKNSRPVVLSLSLVIALAISIIISHICSIPIAIHSTAILWLIIMTSWLISFCLIRSNTRNEVIFLLAANYALLSAIGLSMPDSLGKIGGLLLFSGSILQLFPLYIYIKKSDKTDIDHQQHNELPINKTYSGLLIFSLLAAPISSNFIAELFLAFSLIQYSHFMLIGFFISIYLLSFNLLQLLSKEIFTKVNATSNTTSSFINHALMLLITATVVSIGVNPQLFINFITEQGFIS